VISGLKHIFFLAWAVKHPATFQRKNGSVNAIFCRRQPCCSRGALLFPLRSVAQGYPHDGDCKAFGGICFEGDSTGFPGAAAILDFSWYLGHRLSGWESFI